MQNQRPLACNYIYQKCAVKGPYRFQNRLLARHFLISTSEISLKNHPSQHLTRQTHHPESLNF